jgi:hypothetical protein
MIQDLLQRSRGNEPDERTNLKEKIMETMMTYDEVLEEIYALPVGQIISDQAAETVQSWYDYEICAGRINVAYLMASSHERLCLDHLFDYIIYRVSYGSLLD